jgi:hypothetical protein
MMFWKFAAVLLALPALMMSPLQAAESVNGRWAVDQASCTGFVGAAVKSLFIVTNYAVRWSGDACRIGRMYKTGDTVHIQAFCWGQNGERSIPVSLRAHAGQLAVSWDRGALGDMQRCP